MKQPPMNVPMLTDVVHLPPPRVVIRQTLRDYQLSKLNSMFLHISLRERFYQVEFGTWRGVWALFRMSWAHHAVIQESNDMLRMMIQKYGDIRGYRRLVAGCRKNT